MSTEVVLHIFIQLLTTQSTLGKSFPSPTLLWKRDTGVYFRIRVVSALWKEAKQVVANHFRSFVLLLCSYLNAVLYL